MPFGDGRHAWLWATHLDPEREEQVAVVFVADLETGSWSSGCEYSGHLHENVRPGGRALLALDLSASAPVELAWEDGYVCHADTHAWEDVWYEAGLGVSRVDRACRREYYDPSRNDRFFVDDAFEDLDAPFFPKVRPGPWLVYVWKEGAVERNAGGWYRFDPETGEREWLPWPEGQFRNNSPVVPDGRVLLSVDGSAYLGDAATGVLEELTVDRELSGGVLSWSTGAIVFDDLGYFRVDLERCALESVALEPNEVLIDARSDGSFLVFRRKPAEIFERAPNGEETRLFPVLSANPAGT